MPPWCRTVFDWLFVSYAHSNLSVMIAEIATPRCVTSNQVDCVKLTSLTFCLTLAHTVPQPLPLILLLPRSLLQSPSLSLPLSILLSPLLPFFPPSPSPLSCLPVGDIKVESCRGAAQRSAGLHRAEPHLRHHLLHG